MRCYRHYAAVLLAPVLMVGLALGTSPPARANDAGAFIGGAILGALLTGAFDRDYPGGIGGYNTGGYGTGGYGTGGYGAGGRWYGDERLTWFYYPESGVFALRAATRPYPYGIRSWQFAGRYRGRMVFVPAMYQGWGYRETVRFPTQRPMFVLPRPQYAHYPDTRSPWSRIGGQVFGLERRGYGGYEGQPYGNDPGLFLQYGWQPSPALQWYRMPADGWRQDWNPQNDGWYDLEAKAWRREPGANRQRALGAGPGQKVTVQAGQTQRVGADQDDEDLTPGPAQKVRPKFDESWRDDMGSSRDAGKARLERRGEGGDEDE